MSGTSIIAKIFTSLSTLKGLAKYSVLLHADIKTDKSTPGRLQSKTLLTIDEHGSKINRNSVFYCHLSPVGQQMAIKNSVSNDI